MLSTSHMASIMRKDIRMSLSIEEKEAVSGLINILYDGAIPVEPEIITDETVEQVDNILRQISKCAERMHLLFEGLGLIYEVFSMIAVEKTVLEILEKVGRKVLEDAMKDVLTKLKIKNSNRACLYYTLNLYKSAVSISLAW